MKYCEGRKKDFLSCTDISELGCDGPVKLNRKPAELGDGKMQLGQGNAL